MIFHDIYWWFIPIAGLMAFGACYGIIAMMNSLNMLVLVNDRTSHQHPVPYGGGWVVGCFIFMGIIVDFVNMPHFIKFLTGFLLIFIISLIDDIKNISWFVRLLVHYIACSLALAFVVENSGFGQLFEPLIALIGIQVFNALATLAWLIYINFTNFIDGLDGISTQNSLLITISMAVMLFVAPDLNMPYFNGIMICLLMAVMLGFGIVNKHPAKIFLGDSGAVALGFIHGVCLFCLWGSGYWQQALILAAFPMMECSLTIMARMRENKKIWQSYRDYSFHLLVAQGQNHKIATKPILALHIVIFLCFLSLFFINYIGVIMAYGLVATYHIYVRYFYAATPD